MEVVWTSNCLKVKAGAAGNKVRLKTKILANRKITILMQKNI